MYDGTMPAPPQPTLRPLRSSDFKAVLELFSKTFPEMDAPDFHRAWQAKNDHSSMGLFDKAILIGFGLVSGNRLWFIAIDRAFQSYGYGTMLLRSIMKTMDEVYLAPDNNPKIVDWYKRQGFAIIQTLPFVHKDIPIYMMYWKHHKSTALTS